MACPMEVLHSLLIVVLGSMACPMEALHSLSIVVLTLSR